MKISLSLILLIPAVLIGQQPFINSITPNHAEVGQTVEISGLNLNGSPQVFFGGVEATISFSSPNLITAIVPAATSNASIYVISNNEVAQSNERFFLSFGGTEIIAHDPEFAVSTTEFAASDLCLCDLNGDNKNDIVMVHNREASQNGAEATIFLNNIGDNDTDAFTGSDFQISQSLNVEQHDDGFISVTCNDFDNDGIKDLAFTSNFGTDATDIFVIRNPGTGVFPTSGSGVIKLNLPRTADNDQRQPGSIVSADLDKDGFLDIAIGNNASDGVFHIYRNTSSPGNISFNGQEIEISANAEPTGLLYAADLNNDGLQDIISLPFRESNSGINLLRNLSVPGSFNFEFDQSITNGGQTSDIEVGDLDNDGDLEIIVASNLTGRISFFENQSGAQLNFGGSNNLTSTATTATGVSLADMNGDGSLDIVSSNAAGNIFLFPNTSSTSISFGDEQIQSTAGTTRSIVSGDLNGDAKPDLAYSRNISLDPPEIGFLGIILNRNCITPQISPQEVEFCQGDPFILSTLNTANATYDWQVLTGNGTVTTNGNSEAEITINSGSNATVRVTITQDGCSESSDLNIGIQGGTPPGNPSIVVSSAGVLCVGDDVTLSSSIVSDDYFWVLPDGTDVNTTIIQLNPVTSKDAGTFSLRIQDSGGCVSEEVTQTITVSSPPSLTIVNSGLNNFCDDIILQVPDFSGDGITYQWQESGTNLSETNASLTVSESGSYTVEATNTDNCTTETASISVNKIDLPVSIIDGPTETCVDFLTSFVAASTGAGGFSLLNEWTIEDASNTEIFTSNDGAIDFTFTQTGTYTITLNTRYDPDEVYPGPNENDQCINSSTLNLTVSSAPSISFDTEDLAPKCQDDVLTIGLTSPSANQIASYSWTLRDENQTLDTSTESTINAITPNDTDTVFVTVDIVTTIGCSVSNSIRIRNFISDIDIISPDFPTIKTDDQATLEDGISINLSSENQLTNISWEPAELIDNPSGVDIQYFPRTPTSLVTLSGVDMDGCNVSTQVTINLDNLRPKKTFSPNGDGVNDCWEILNIGDLGEDNGCELYIFDSRGRNETPVITSFDDGNCVWNGTSSGTDVPEGIYYYVLKCNQEEFSKSGSILLAR